MRDAEEPEQPPDQRAPGSGDPLLEALERLRAAEERRRSVPRQSTEFTERARDVEARAREVFRLAELEGPVRYEEAEPDAEPGEESDEGARAS